LIHRVGLVSYTPVGAPFPARATRRPPRDPGFACVCAGCLDPVALRGWLGWVHYRLVGLRGRPSPTRAQARFRRDRPAGCHATGCGPDPPHPALLLDDHGQTTPGSAPHAQVHDQQERDINRRVSARSKHISCRGAGQVPILLITPQIPGVARGEDGTTASRVARNCGGLVGDGRAPASRTAARATT
jgi:hypothetical protein